MKERKLILLLGMDQPDIPREGGGVRVYLTGWAHNSNQKVNTKRARTCIEGEI